MMRQQPMAATIDHVYEAAMSLSDAVRLELVEKLMPTISTDAEIESEQLRIVLQRAEEMDKGLVQPVPAEKVFQRVEHSLIARC
jgi:hypothetical protein